MQDVMVMQFLQPLAGLVDDLRDLRIWQFDALLQRYVVQVHLYPQCRTPSTNSVMRQTAFQSSKWSSKRMMCGFYNLQRISISFLVIDQRSCRLIFWLLVSWIFLMAYSRLVGLCLQRITCPNEPLPRILICQNWERLRFYQKQSLILGKTSLLLIGLQYTSSHFVKPSPNHCQSLTLPAQSTPLSLFVECSSGRPKSCSVLFFNINDSNPISNRESTGQGLMQNDQPQKPLILNHLLYGLAAVVLVSVAGTCRFLMMIFTQLNNWKKEEKEKEIGQNREGDERAYRYVNEMKHVYHMLLALLYLVYYAAAVTLPLLLLSYFSTFLALALSFGLVFLFGEILPRAVLGLCSPLSILVRWGWVITFTKFINRLIPLNGRLKKMFITEIVQHKSTHPFITKDNVHRLLDLLGKPVRQEEVELLEKLRLLGHNPSSSLMIPKCNIFILELQSELTMRLVNHLSKYYFTKILVYSGSRDNIIGYMQFKQLLAFQLNQRIAAHKEVICTQLVRLHPKDNLAVAMERMIETKVNFALVYEGKSLLGLVKLKDIFARLLLKWYNYEGLNAERSFNSISSMISLGRDYRCNLEEGVEQH